MFTPADKTGTNTAEGRQEDPVIDRFLSFLAEDINRRPDALVELSPALAQRLSALTEGVEIDLDAPIEGDVDGLF